MPKPGEPVEINWTDWQKQTQDLQRLRLENDYYLKVVQTATAALLALLELRRIEAHVPGSAEELMMPVWAEMRKHWPKVE